MSRHPERPTPAEQAFLAEIQSLAKDHQPNDRVRQAAGRLTVVAALGPAGIGKTTAIDASGYHRVGLTGTRPRRSGEQDYEHLDVNDVAVRLAIRHDLRSGNYVQAHPHSGTGHLYATRLNHYDADGVNAFAPTMAAYQQLRRQDLFGSLAGVYLVAPFDTWQLRWLGRDTQITPAEYAGRMDEAAVSLAAARDDPSVSIIVNNDLSRLAGAFTAAAEADEPVRSDEALAVTEEMIAWLGCWQQTGRPFPAYSL